MDLLFSTLIIFSQILFFKAWTEDDPGNKAVWAFALAGLAVLTKGPLGIAFPLVTGVAYLLVMGQANKLKDKKMLQGLGVFLGMLLLWVLAALAVEGEAFLHNIFHDQIYKRAVSSWHHEEPFQYYFIALPLSWLPWTLMLIGLNWRKARSKEFWKSVWAGRKDNPGLTFIWVMFLSGFTLLSLVSIKVLIYILPLLSPLAVITARQLGKLEPRGASRFWCAVGVLFTALALVAPLANFFTPSHLDGLGYTFLIFIVLGPWLIFFRKSSPKTLVLALLLGLCLWIQPASRLTTPSMDAFMSPKAQATLMKDYISKGFHPVAYKIYSGVYTYYAGQNLLEAHDWDELNKDIAGHDKIVIGMREKHWKKWPDKPKNLKVVDKQRIVDQIYVLAVTE